MSGTSCFCPDCAAPPGMSRREDFLHAAAAGLAALPMARDLSLPIAPSNSKNQSESLVG